MKLIKLGASLGASFPLRLTGQLLAAWLGGGCAHQPPREQWGHFAMLDAWREDDKKAHLDGPGASGSISL